MNKKQKEHLSVIPGHGSAAAVVNGDINFALSMWKRQLKEQNTINVLKSNKEYKKPTTVRREQRNNAIYYEKIKSMNEPR